MPGLDKLFACSFRGVPFYWIGSTSTTGGRKTVTHEFVNSDFRATEDLGKKLKTYTMTAVVFGDDFTDQRDRLLDALDRPGKGVLVHPTFGRVEVVAKPYTVVESDTEIGQSTISLVFEKAQETILPQAGISDAATVSDLSDNLNDTLETDTAENFEVTSLKPNSFKSALQGVNSFANKINSVTEFFSGPIDAVAQLSSTLQNINDNVTDLIAAPLQLANGVRGVIDQTDNLFADAEAQFDSLKNLFGYRTETDNLTDSTETFSGGSSVLSVVAENLPDGFDPVDRPLSDAEALGNSLTNEELEIIRNEKVLVRQIRVTALSKAYSSAALIDFANIEELDSTAAALQNQYEVAVSDEDMPIETRDILQALRDAFEELLNERRVTLRRITEIDINPVPVQVLAYQLYADSSFSTDLINLNDDPNVSHLQGTVRVLTA